jgi:hypothetical protein
MQKWPAGNPGVLPLTIRGQSRFAGYRQMLAFGTASSTLGVQLKARVDAGRLFVEYPAGEILPPTGQLASAYDNSCRFFRFKESTPLGGD